MLALLLNFGKWIAPVLVVALRHSNLPPSLYWKRSKLIKKGPTPPEAQEEEAGCNIRPAPTADMVLTKSLRFIEDLLLVRGPTEPGLRS